MSEVNTNTNVPGTDPTTAPQQQQEKTFTQAEVDALITQRLARERKKMPTDEELKGYREWVANQQTEGDKLASMTKERDDAQSALKTANDRIAALEQEQYIHSKGFAGEEAEFIAFKAAKMVDEKTTFQQAVDALTKDKTAKVKVDLGGSVGGGKKSMTKEEIMNIKDAAARQKAIFENRELFGI